MARRSAATIRLRRAPAHPSPGPSPPTATTGRTRSTRTRVSVSPTGAAASQQLPGRTVSISLLLEMAASTNPERAAVVSGEIHWSTAELSGMADGGAGVITSSGMAHVAYVGTGGAMLPLLIFSAARSGVPFTP